ncbi:phosphoglycerate kinase [Candidatus Woesearchaeota archaeon]|nr:phosphoglycerate kinase [Candidatus Woesearchaeota archaeon]
MAYKTLYDVQVTGKRILVRSGFDMPIDEQGNITDDKRIRDTLPTLKFLLEYQAKVIILNHFGRPKGIEEKYKHDKIAQLLSKYLNTPVKKLDDCVGEHIEQAVMAMKAGDVIMLENVRFHSEEKDKDPNVRDAFGQKLAKLGELYVNEAFSNCHRDHASMTSIPKFLPSVAGFLVQKEIETITKVLKNPKRPFVAIIGGAKLETKIPVIKNLLPKTDKILLGGEMVFTFFKAKGMKIGNSLVDENLLNTVKDFLDEADDKILLPSDIVVADKLAPDAKIMVVAADSIPNGYMGADIGNQTVEEYLEVLSAAKTVIWNGPLGVIEIPTFSNGTNEIALALGDMEDTTIVIGGGDTAVVINKLNLEKKMTHVSTGGGASLALFGGEELPAIKALEENAKKFWK